VLATVALLLFGLTGAVTRWRAGMLADRLGSRILLPLALVIAAVGMVLTALGLWAGPAWVLTGAAVFGAGFGATQNLTLLAAFARAGEGGTTTASAMWNIAFDAGTAIGALALGFLAAGIGLDWTYVVVAALLAAALPVASAAARVAVRS
jgi:predicted MFS family arabinose efflux permease